MGRGQSPLHQASQASLNKGDTVTTSRPERGPTGREDTTILLYTLSPASTWYGGHLRERERGRVKEKVREREKRGGEGEREREREGGESDIYARETQKDRKCVL